MHAMHARLPVNFVLEERLERYANVIETKPGSYRGRWAHACWPLDGTDRHFDEVRVDLGCGKGAYIVESARRNPKVLFVGIDAVPLCMAYAAQHVMEAGLRNAVVIPTRADALPRIFAPGEVHSISVNFPTPYPRKRDASQRIITLDRLMEYRQVLTPGGTICLRTDSQPFRDFALTQFDLAGYDITYSSDDQRSACPDEPTTEYEQRLAKAGAKTLCLVATPGPEPTHVRQTAPLSLVDYLPDDLFVGRYVPHGMEQTVHNLLRRANKRKRSR